MRSRFATSGRRSVSEVIAGSEGACLPDECGRLVGRSGQTDHVAQLVDSFNFRLRSIAASTVVVMLAPEVMAPGACAHLDQRERAHPRGGSMGHNSPAAALSVGHHHCTARIVTS